MKRLAMAALLIGSLSVSAGACLNDRDSDDMEGVLRSGQPRKNDNAWVVVGGVAWTVVIGTVVVCRRRRLL